MISRFCSSNLLVVNCRLLFCVVLLISQPLNFLVMNAVFLYGLEP
jgi:hypothetical protein